ncbi:hypothetical protein [Actinomadura sp. NTSP31]|uniref:hypothetical protein n=1 Tax=Actinomadura sp. NTSP31 TaxID=1735447 RepID=UPI0035BECE87
MSPRADFAGAVYGSLLAASVVAGTSPREDPVPASSLAILLLATGLVFWLAHAYARLAGERSPGTAVDWPAVRSVAAAERPLAEAALPPAAVAVAGRLAGLDDATTAWLALLVALGGQVGWALAASYQAGAPRRRMLLAGLVNLFLGLVIVALKVLLAH